MNRARRQGGHSGAPPAAARAGFAERWAAVRADLEAGQISRSEAARRPDCGYGRVLRLLQVEGKELLA